MALRSLKRKPSLVDRLRQLRTAALSPSKTTFTTEKRPSYVPIQPADEQPVTHFRDEGPKKPMSNPRSRSYYPETSLDLGELDFKLEQYAKKTLESTETGMDSETGGPLGRETSRVQQTKDQVATADPSDDEPERDPSSCLEPVASLEPPSQELGSVESCLIAPQQEALDDTRPSDYELFLRDAEQAERRRLADVERFPRPPVEPELNPFYSNNWDHHSQPSPKLGGIQEAGDDDERDGHEEGHAIRGDQDSERQALSSEASTERGDVNVAPPKSTISRANTDVTGGGRHIKFSNMCVPRDRVERRASAPNCATRVKSPSRPVRKQKSIKQLIADYIRPPRG